MNDVAMRILERVSVATGTDIKRLPALYDAVDVDAREATRMGLATRTFPEDGFDAHVQGVVDLLAGYDPAALSEIKFFLREIDTVDPEDRRDVVLDRMT